MPEAQTQFVAVTLRRRGSSFELEDDTGTLRHLQVVSRFEGRVVLTNGKIWVSVSKLCGPDLFSDNKEGLGEWKENIGLLGSAFVATA